MATLLALAGALLAAGAVALVPGRGRVPARVVFHLLLVLAPVVLVAAWIGTFRRATIGSWLALVPVIVTWACIVDARRGLSSRLARIGPRTKPPSPRA